MALPIGKTPQLVVRWHGMLHATLITVDHPWKSSLSLGGSAISCLLSKVVVISCPRFKKWTHGLRLGRKVTDFHVRDVLVSIGDTNFLPDYRH